MQPLYHRFLEETDSTNEEIKRLILSNAPEFSVVSAGMQTLGKGRLGRSWNSPKGESVSTSILIYPSMDEKKIKGITILSALSVSSAIFKLYGIDPQIKWPNDVLINKKKVSGILTEQIIREDKSRAVICGIGINVNQRAFPKELEDIATSIDIELNGKGTGKRKELTYLLWDIFYELYKRYEKEEDLSFIKEEYERRLISKGKEVLILDPLGEYRALSEGINSFGEMIVSLDNGEKREVDSGEVSVRGIYGYS